MTTRSEKRRSSRRAPILFVLVALAALTVTAVAVRQLPRRHPGLWLRIAYVRADESIMYTGLRPPDLEDETRSYRQRFSLIPGPDRLEADFFRDGEVALLATPLRREILFRSPRLERTLETIRPPVPSRSR